MKFICEYSGRDVGRKDKGYLSKENGTPIEYFYIDCSNEYESNMAKQK